MGVIGVILFLGILSQIQGSPILEQSGFRNLVVAINDDVPEDKGSALIKAIKELMTETSETMYYASNTRFYIKEVTILTPGGWTLPEIGGEARHGEVYQDAAVKITKTRDTEYGDLPHTKQPGGCGEEGNPVDVSSDYLLDLLYRKDDMILKYGPIGNLLTQEFTKYRYGIFDEYGFPGTDEEKYPSTYIQAFLDPIEGQWKTAVVNNTCADAKQDGKLFHIKGEGKNNTIMEGCTINDLTGEIDSDSCFFAADVEQSEALSSMGSYQYTDLVTVFCDEEDFPHNHDVANMQNDQCLDETRDYEPMSTWTTILKHTDFLDGNNDGGYVDSTVPEFKVYSGSVARFVLVLDNSGSMSSCSRIDNLRITLMHWVDDLKPGTEVAIVKFGDNNQCVSGSNQIDKDCFVRISEENSGEKEKLYLIEIISKLDANMGSTAMFEALESAYKIMKARWDFHRVSNPGTVLLVTDGMANGPRPDIDSPDLWQPFHQLGSHVIGLCLGHEIDHRMEVLVTKTDGRAFVSSDCSAVDDDAFQYASRTYIPRHAGDESMKERTTSQGLAKGTSKESKACKEHNDGKHCLKHRFNIDKSYSRDVTVAMKMSTMKHPKVEAKDLIKQVSVRKIKTDINGTIEYHPELEGFKLSWGKEAPYAYFNHHELVPDEDTEQLYDVFLTLPQDLNDTERFRTNADFTTTAKFNSAEDPDADYSITCKHPAIMKVNEPFLIQSNVKRGSTDIKYANVFARVTVSRASDPGAEREPFFFELRDDGKESVSGDKKANDGTYTAHVTPQQIEIADGTGLSIMCNLMASPDGKWDDNNFFNGKTKAVPTQRSQTPYCCGTTEQKWNNPQTKDVVKLMRSSDLGGAFVDPKVREKGIDYGPPSRIADLRAEKFGETNEGLVKLSWSATGDDWVHGTVKEYSLVYSDKRKGLMSSNKITRSSHNLIGGSLEPVPAGNRMEVVLKIDNFHVPGTYLFAVRALDDAGKESVPSNIARVNFHDGSPVVLDANPHHVHGHKKNDLPFEDKIRARFNDERIVQGYLKHIEKNKMAVTEAENNVIERRLKEKMGLKDSAAREIMKKIKTHAGMREIYKKKLL